MRNMLYERRIRRKYERKQIDRELRKEFDIEESRSMYQYSKILTTVILIFTIVINAFYFLYIVPHTGALSITDSGMEYSAAILKIWDAGTIVFFCGYFAKSLFETKFEEDNKFNDQRLKDTIQEKMSSILEEINS